MTKPHSNSVTDHISWIHSDVPDITNENIIYIIIIHLFM